MDQATLIQAVWAELKPDLPPRNPSDCVIRCYLLPKGPERTKCLQECEEQAAIAAVAAKLRTELFKSFAEVIWAGGDIDPRPLEEAVRTAFGRSARTTK
jgi:hypothetical protein